MAVSGNGWNPDNGKPFDRNLWLGKILHDKQNCVIKDQQIKESNNSLADLVECLLFQNANLEKELKSEKEKRIHVDKIKSNDNNQQTEIFRIQLLQLLVSEKESLCQELKNEKQKRIAAELAQSSNVGPEMYKKLIIEKTKMENELKIEKQIRINLENSHGNHNQSLLQTIGELRREKANLEYELQQSEHLRMISTERRQSKGCCVVM